MVDVPSYEPDDPGDYSYFTSEQAASDQRMLLSIAEYEIIESVQNYLALGGKETTVLSLVADLN